ncbi:hypothetical protein [Trebonia kvetii]|uniref:hypothetical protein n=1 Tax=Trebonia kvetii TaxID=2480626 RepID=UPI001FEA60B2|nr:hypothetical protein [Trebonia kvetii]
MRCLRHCLFALGTPAVTDEAQAARANPRAMLDAVRAPVLARGRLTGSFER